MFLPQHLVLYCTDCQRNLYAMDMPPVVIDDNDE